MKQKGFTLAEVLITLAIIGVVAALTIPSVISNYQQMEFKTGLKKAVSVLNEAITIAISKDGESPHDNADLYLYLQKHMNILKSGVIHTPYTTQGAGSAGYTNFVFYTADGMRFEIKGHHSSRTSFKLYESDTEISANRAFGEYVGNCGSYGLKTDINNTNKVPCIILVDVNGDKKPNPSNLTSDSGISDAGHNSTSAYSYPMPTDKKINDLFNILITEEKAIPFGVVAQRAMYSK